MKFIDLTHTFTNNMPVYPGDPQPTLKQVAHIDKDGYNDHAIHSVMHVGTHMDAPLHMIEHGRKMHEMEIERFIGKGVLIDARGKDRVDIELLENSRIEQGNIVLIYTGFASKFNTDAYYKNFPTITTEFAQVMVELGVSILGMDMLSPDQPPFPTHKILLGNDILIIENLTNLDRLVGKEFEIIALPAKLDADAAPVRVVAKIL